MEASSRTSVMADNEVFVRPDDAISYRSVSVLSIVSLVVGLMAPLSLVGPLLWVIPIVGAAISLAAIQRISASDGALVGRSAALVGLMLCVISISAAASRSTFAKFFVSRQAREVALEWIATLQAGNVHQAFDRTVDGTRLDSAPPSGAPEHRDEQAHQPGGELALDNEHADSPLDSFRERPVVDFLMTDGADWQADFDGDLAVEFGARGDVRVQQQFLLRTAGSSATAKAVSVQIILIRSRQTAPGASGWLVSDFQSDDLLPRTAHAQ